MDIRAVRRLRTLRLSLSGLLFVEIFRSSNNATVAIKPIVKRIPAAAKRPGTNWVWSRSAIDSPSTWLPMAPVDRGTEVSIERRIKSGFLPTLDWQASFPAIVVQMPI